MQTPVPCPPHISATRLWNTLEQYARFGATVEGGVSRCIFSAADMAARQQLMADGRARGLAVRIDAAANVFCSRPGSGTTPAPILIGSHLDSVPNGGRYDGALGVICGLEVLHTLEEHAISTQHPVVLVSFTGEEATAFGTASFGSRALAGRLADLAANRLPDGRTIRQALADSGGNWDTLSTTHSQLGPIACFLEVHIEQGKRLEGAGLPLAAVSGVTGIYRHRIVFRGVPNHAGTTAMSDRHDALRAAARFVLAVADVPQTVAPTDPSATVTVGYLEVLPNSPNVIPGQVTVVTDLRSAKPELLSALAERVGREAHRAAKQQATSVEISTSQDQPPVSFDRQVRTALAAVIAELGGHKQELTSQAGHDAVHMQALAPAGMLFVRCAAGVSHCPEESITPEDAAKAANALLQTVLLLDSTLG